MGASQRKAVLRHRARLKERGQVRVEVHASDTDAALIRALARVLRRESARAHQIRRALRDLLHPQRELGRKALLASAPLEGIPLSRARDDYGRKVEL